MCEGDRKLTAVIENLTVCPQGQLIKREMTAVIFSRIRGIKAQPQSWC